MMEPHSVMKMKTTMEPKLTPARKEIFNDSFFIRKSIISDAGNVADPNPKQTANEQLSMGNCQSSIDNHKKNFIMKTFLRKSFLIAIALVIANLFLVQNGFSQSQTFSTPGTTTFTVPDGVTTITVQAWGGGGGGGAVNGSLVKNQQEAGKGDLMSEQIRLLLFRAKLIQLPLVRVVQPDLQVQKRGRWR